MRPLQAWELMAEPIQTVMRRFNIPGAYEKLKAASRTPLWLCLRDHPMPRNTSSSNRHHSTRDSALLAPERL